MPSIIPVTNIKKSFDHIFSHICVSETPAKWRLAYIPVLLSDFQISVPLAAISFT